MEWGNWYLLILWYILACRELVGSIDPIDRIFSCEILENQVFRNAIELPHSSNLRSHQSLPICPLLKWMTWHDHFLQSRLLGSFAVTPCNCCILASSLSTLLLITSARVACYNQNCALISIDINRKGNWVILRRFKPPSASTIILRERFLWSFHWFLPFYTMIQFKIQNRVRNSKYKLSLAIILA